MLVLKARDRLRRDSTLQKTRKRPTLKWLYENVSRSIGRQRVSTARLTATAHGYPQFPQLHSPSNGVFLTAGPRLVHCTNISPVASAMTANMLGKFLSFTTTLTKVKQSLAVFVRRLFFRIIYGNSFLSRTHLNLKYLVPSFVRSFILHPSILPSAKLVHSCAGFLPSSPEGAVYPHSRWFASSRPNFGK